MLDNDRVVVRLLCRRSTFIKLILEVDGKSTIIFYADPEAEFRMVDVERVSKCGEKCNMNVSNKWMDSHVTRCRADEVEVGDHVFIREQWMKVDNNYLHQNSPYAKMNLLRSGTNIPLANRLHVNSLICCVKAKDMKVELEKGISKLDELVGYLSTALEKAKSLKEVANYSHECVRIFGTDLSKESFEKVVKEELDAALAKAVKAFK